MAEWFFFDTSEHAVIREALEWVAARAPPQGDRLRAGLDRLASLAAVVRDGEALAATWPTELWREGPSDALVDVLCRVPEYDFELHIPTRAVIGQAYLVTKINFFKSVGYALVATDAPAALRARMDDEIEQSIYSKIVEELFAAVVTDADLPRPVKLRAVELLFRLWGDRLLAEVDDVAPLLESAWQARNRVRPVLGTLLGTHELYGLFREMRDERFLEYYTGREGVPDEEMAAFEEFLFGLSYEDLAALRRHQAESGLSVVTPADARRILGGRDDAWAAEIVGPQAIYTNFRRRKMQAMSRTLTHCPGPRKVAEEYVIVAFLQR